VTCPAASGDTAETGEIEVAEGAGGHFVFEAEVNGETVVFLVDTGASVVVLGARTAERLGFDADELDFLGRGANRQRNHADRPDHPRRDRHRRLDGERRRGRRGHHADGGVACWG